MGDVILFIDDFQSTSNCRICHEAEFESCNSFEAPCACSGTLKFAHRDCIQRWCNEKGNTICEICLQNYEPGYTAISKKSQLIDTLTIRDGFEINVRENNRDSDDEFVEIGDELTETTYRECTSAAERSVNFCRSLAITFTVLLVLKNIMATLAIGTEHYPFTIVTILALRASGVILPMYILFRTITAIKKGLANKHQDSDLVETSDFQEYEARQHLL